MMFSRDAHPRDFDTSDMNTQRPSLRSANWLYLISMLLILTVGSYLQSRALSWGLLATEIGLILVPALLLLWRGRLAPRLVLRMRWPGLRLVILGAVIGAGVWGLDMGLQGLAAVLLGYAPQSALSSLSSDPLNLIVFVFAMTVAAPLCEEVFFRGVLLSAYGRYRPIVALTAVGLLFAFFHLQLEGLVALLPIALTLGWLAHRSHSLAPSIAAHVANNGLGAVLAVAMRLYPALSSGQALTVALCSAMVVGPLLAIAALWVFLRLTRQPAPPVAPPAELPAPAPTRAAGRGAFWPLAGAAVIYLVCAGLELTMGRFPEVLTASRLELQPAPWTEPVRLAYFLWNVENEQVGEASCTLTPQAGAVAFDCLTSQRSFEAHLGQSMYAGGRYVLTQTGRWDAATMQLLEADLKFAGEYSSWTARVGADPQGPPGLNLWLDGGAPRALPADAVIAAEWPWRMMALPYGRSAFFGSHFNQVLLAAGQETGQVADAVLVVRGEEDLLTPPSGHALAWKISVGQQTAWYAAEAPHPLLRYNDGYGVTWTVDLNSLSDIWD